jgi:endonuclease-8
MEGPSLLILREELEPFLGQKVLEATGNTTQPKATLTGRRIDRVETWGKNLFLTFSASSAKAAPIVTKTHFLMFGSYRINEVRPGRTPRLALKFRKGIVYFYSCSIRFFADEYREALDPRVDLMSSEWDERHVVDLMAPKRNSPLCDLLLDQTVFAGSGNIIKNEVLFNIRRHPLTRLSRLARQDWLRLAQAVHSYCWNFYEWKKKFELRKHWQVYRQRLCPLCERKLIREPMGKNARLTFYCSRHQPLYTQIRKMQVSAVLEIKPKPHSTSELSEHRLDH